MASFSLKSIRVAALVTPGRKVRVDIARGALAVASIASMAVGTVEMARAVEPDEKIEEVLVKGQEPATPDLFVVSPTRATPNAPDSAELMQLVPGGGVVNNGPLSGQVQYRGMFGGRVGVRIDDMYLSPGGPNWMDPPLHYAPRMLVVSLTVERGIASVSA